MIMKKNSQGNTRKKGKKDMRDNLNVEQKEHLKVEDKKRKSKA